MSAAKLLPMRGASLIRRLASVFLAGGGQRCGRGVVLKQIQHGGVNQARPEHALKRRMNLREQAAHAVGGLICAIRRPRFTFLQAVFWACRNPLRL